MFLFSASLVKTLLKCGVFFLAATQHIIQRKTIAKYIQYIHNWHCAMSVRCPFFCFSFPCSRSLQITSEIVSLCFVSFFIEDPSFQSLDRSFQFISHSSLSECYQDAATGPRHAKGVLLCPLFLSDKGGKKSPGNVLISKVFLFCNQLQFWTLRARTAGSPVFCNI